MKSVFRLGCYGCIFHGTGNSAQLCQNFGISGGGGFEPPTPSVRHWLSVVCSLAGLFMGVGAVCLMPWKTENQTCATSRKRVLFAVWIVINLVNGNKHPAWQTNKSAGVNKCRNTGWPRGAQHIAAVSRATEWRRCGRAASEGNIKYEGKSENKVPYFIATK
jgi:hypothetical protein